MMSVNWKKLARHPLSSRYPDITGPAWEDFLANLKEHGPGNRPIVLHEGKVLDGWQLLRGCIEIGKEPKIVTLAKKTDPVVFVETANERRRHESAEAMQKRREERRAKVAELAADGQSTRQIADAVGASSATVHRDLADIKDTSGDLSVSPETKTTILCDHCKRLRRTGQPLPKGCPDCKELRKAAKDEKTEPTPELVPEGLSEEAAALLRKHHVKMTDEQLKALAGYTEETQVALAESVAEKRQTLDKAVSTGEVPEPTVEDSMKEINGRIESFCRRLMAVAEEECPEDFWLAYQGRRDVFFQKLKDCCSQLRGGKCHAVCPKCDGAGCKVCLKTGRLPRLQYDQVV